MSDVSQMLKPPFEVRFSENVAGRYGYKDAHVEIDVRLPKLLRMFQNEYHASFSFEQTERLDVAVDEAVKWESVPEDFRRDMPEPYEVVLGELARAHYGWKDAHVELKVLLPKVCWLVQKEYTERFEAHEVRQLQAALKKVVSWGRLRPEERERIGA